MNSWSELPWNQLTRVLVRVKVEMYSEEVTNETDISEAVAGAGAWAWVVDRLELRSWVKRWRLFTVKTLLLSSGFCFSSRQSPPQGPNSIAVCCVVSFFSFFYLSNNHWFVSRFHVGFDCLLFFTMLLLLLVTSRFIWQFIGQTVAFAISILNSPWRNGRWFSKVDKEPIVRLFVVDWRIQHLVETGRGDVALPSRSHQQKLKTTINKTLQFFLLN